MSSAEQPLPIPAPPPATAPRPWALAPEPEPVFGLLEVFFIALFLAFCILGTGLASVAIAHHVPALKGVRTADLAMDARVLLTAQLAAYLLLFVLLWRLFAVHHRISLRRALQWQWPVRWLRLCALGVALAVVVQLASSLLPSPPELPIDQMLRTPLDAWLMSLFGVLIAPLIEEVLFRGLLFTAVARRAGAWVALVVSAGFFGAMHAAQLGGAWSQVSMIVLVGLVLGVVRWRWHSLAASTLVHMSYNGVLFAALFAQTRGVTHLTGH